MCGCHVIFCTSLWFESISQILKCLNEGVGVHLIIMNNHFILQAYGSVINLGSDSEFFKGFSYLYKNLP